MEKLKNSRDVMGNCYSGGDVRNRVGTGEGTGSLAHRRGLPLLIQTSLLETDLLQMFAMSTILVALAMLSIWSDLVII